MRDLLRSDIPQELVVNAALLALSPLVLLAMDAGVGFVPLLAPPLFAVYKVSSIALQRERQALTDPLTGLANRGALAEATGRAVVAPDAAVALLLFDLDRFKEVNDRWGHAAGDDMLRSVAELINSLPESLAVRLGGDEFALLLRPHRDALDLCEQLRMQMQELLVRSGADVSVGVAAVRAPEEIRLALRRADEALYQRKRNGGAGLTVWTDLAAPAQRHVERELDRRALR
jgi:diguanylate cyclase (GGDEF)-like protein